MSAKRKTKQLIKEIEAARKSQVLVYVVGDRQSFPAQIAEDVVRPMYEHLLAFEKITPKRKKLDLFLYSIGGDVSVPWRIVSMCREFFPEFNLLIPYKAYSAATMIALGADEILMGKKAELSPIDSTLVRNDADNPIVPPQISVEDVLSYVSFIKERVEITNQEALAKLTSILSENLTPLALGSVNREHSHIRLVARKLLTSHKKEIDEERVSIIVESLTEKMYSHGHSIGRKEAKEVGLPVKEMEKDLEDMTWQLFEEYEKELSLREPFDLEILLADKEQHRLKDLPLAILESSERLHRREVQGFFKKNREMPNNLEINVNFNVESPAEIPHPEKKQQMEKALSEIRREIDRYLPELVQEEVIRQAPIINIGGRVFGDNWVEK